MFKKGEAVVHPTRGAGIVQGFTKFERDGDTGKYYQIMLLNDSNTKLMVPVEGSGVLLRPPLSESRMKRVWRMLRAAPETLPDDYKVRQKGIEAKLVSGDILQITEVVRDMTWRQHEKNDLTKRGKEILERGVALLVAEIAAAQGIDLTQARDQVSTRLNISAQLNPA